MSEINWNAVKCFDGKLSPALYNRLVDICQALVIAPGNGYKVARSITGTTLQIKPGTTAAGTPEAFTVSTAPIDGDDSNVSVNIRPGTVNGQFATNVFDALTVANSGLIYIKLSIETDGQNLTSYSIVGDSSEPDGQSATANSLPTSFDITIAVINDGKVYQILSGSLNMFGVQSFTVDKDPSDAEPGTSTITPYFVWNLIKL